MKKHEYSKDMPLGDLKRVSDFLPPPEKLVMPERSVKVTLRLNANSLRFFKDQARKNHTKYQRMIRNLVDRYAERYQLGDGSPG